MVFGVSRPKRLSVVDVKEFGKARQELERRDVGSFGDGVRRCAHPLPETGERPLYAVSDCVGRELRHFAKSLSEARQMFREDFAPDVAAYPHRGEICAGEDKRGHVADARVGRHPDVLEAVRLLDEADRLLDPPPREIALDDAPLRLEREYKSHLLAYASQEASGIDGVRKAVA